MSYFFANNFFAQILRLLSINIGPALRPSPVAAKTEMLAFFKPLRRKIGVLTLMIACILTGLWIRAAFVRDLINLPMQLALACDRQEISLVKPQKMPSNWGQGILFSSRYRVWNGFELIPVLTIPHMLTTVPLTLLSVWLLLSKPRMKSVTGPTVSAHHE